ncbi:MAG: YbhB/YbcL family Raf kinase inhibitor-like protein [SAR202 cluster bacterium]|jgi:hypothetical protein|nr:YbhB/YbcL family Raf kinase inhibitor-like protein [SAR202 cluster bacterium]MQG59362.1 YbhB/YbcL family Raf kinase inhibitor-like protein [SAR202 cluster bacterium]MQG69928.1 YbhB/YbcL family Raf kinase inhibitor-like protein [SAR202 cluster bacterium]HAL46210.1 YbhB/YbcL family Raf kinase inhibitor-like protein [Dehalococcoidia bacterium]
MRQHRPIRRLALASAIAAFAAFAVVSLAACSKDDADATPVVPAAAAAIVLTSTAFEHGSAIPRRHTCDDADLSPPLAWTGVPDTARSLALIVDDPDAPRGTWVHWVLYGMAADTNELSEGASADELAAIDGKNDFGRVGYGGPCPPSGSAHRYFFNLYALDTSLSLALGASKSALMSAMEGHTLTQGTLMGTYTR